MGELHDKTEAISAYLHEGGTWNRLKSIAVNSTADGGLGLFAEGSHDYHAMFGTSPPRNMDERPDTTAALLHWLINRHATLARLVRHDIATRELKVPVKR